jgi:hypothetical protein
VSSGAGKYEDYPKFEERQDDVLFECWDDVWISVSFASEKKLRFQLWRGTVMLPPTDGNPYSDSFREKLVDKARAAINGDKKDKQGNPLDLIPAMEDQLDKVCSELSDRSSGSSLHDKLADAAGRTLTEQLIIMAEDSALLFKTRAKVAHAVCPKADHTEVLAVDSRDFSRWLRTEWQRRETERATEIAKRARDLQIQMADAMTAEDLQNAPLHVLRPAAIPPASLKTAVDEIRDSALEHGPTEEVYLRVAGHGGKLYLDLCNKLWQAVEVSKGGYRVIESEDLPVRFVRSNIMLPLPTPEDGGSVDDLKDMLALPPEGREQAWSLIASWVCQALSPCPGDVPILVLLGGHGTAKTSITELLRNLIDPQDVEHEQEDTYRDLKNLHADLEASWVFAVDNITSLPGFLSDTFARISSGAGFKPRKYYTQREQEVFKGKRPLVLNGIGSVVRKSDILDRSLLIDLAPMPDALRREKLELKASFEEKHPAILGAFLSALSSGLRALPNTTLKDDEKSRLVDFDRWAVACERGLGIKPGTYVAARKGSRERSAAEALEEEPVWEAVYSFAHKHSQQEPWMGTMKELLSLVSDEEDDAN